MLNIDKYRKEIEQIGIRSIAMDNDTRKLTHCKGMSCMRCGFFLGEGKSCEENTLSWLLEEYEETEPRVGAQRNGTIQ
ncbi:hypothetical protein [Anaerofustis stercorihominis]|uniref:hypothetical protein n=1 Tax=Anaerofustis stercorihominis TaxID=214853 RepID=UPI0039840BF6